MKSHDVSPGPLNHCQICGNTDLFEIIDLGHQPLCGAMLTAEQLKQPEVTYPLKLNMCPKCGLAQLSYVVPGEIVYPASYPYRSGITRELAEYQRAFAADVVARLGTPARSLVVDIGSNDGTLLSGFKALGMRTFGVEPTDIADICLASGIQCHQGFFTEAAVRDIRNFRLSGNRAAIITATNSFAHMADLGEVMRGIDALLAPDGVFITESHYLLDVLEKNQFDTIYHEHIRTYSLRSLCALFGQYGMEVFDVQRAERYGGNIRAYVARKGMRPVAEAVGDLLKLEVDSLLFNKFWWWDWAERIAHNRDAYRDWRGSLPFHNVVWGKGCPGRGMTLLNYFSIGRDDMPAIAEQPTSLKLNMFTPGSHIPVVTDDELLETEPDYLLILSWHYADPIMADLRAKGYRGKFVKPLPTFKVID